MVLELGVPEEDFDHLWRGVADQWPSYLAYATSFMTIGGIWLVHYGIFRRLAMADGVVTRLNLLLLMFVAFLPFPTKLVAEAVDTGSSERLAVMFYGLVLLAISIAITVLWRHVAGHRDLLDPSVSDADVAARTQQAAPNVGFYAAVVLLALVAPQIAAFGYLAIATVVLFRRRGDYTARSTAGSQRHPRPATLTATRGHNHGTPSPPRRRRAAGAALSDAREARLDRRRRLDRGRPGREGLQGRWQGAARP